MTISQLEIIETPSKGKKKKTIHAWCGYCGYKVSLCGLTSKTACPRGRANPKTPEVCVVCEDLEPFPHDRCGR